MRTKVYWEESARRWYERERISSATRGPAGHSATTNRPLTMTTNYAHYLVAYPHPSVPKRSRIKLFKLDYETSGEMLRELLKSIYKEHSSDLDSATLWTASHSAMAQFPP